MIQVSRLQKRFGGVVAVDGIDFEIQPGQTFGLLGPNGAGKTTTIHLLIGLLRPDGGEIHIQGDSDPTRPEVRRHIGIAPQALSLYEELTAAENLAFFASKIPAGSTWTVSGVGRAAWTMAATAIALGGHLRVGFEDNIYLGKGQKAASNGELVAKVVRIAKELGREIATPAEAREILSLKPLK